MASKQISGIVAAVLGFILLLAPLAFGIPLAFGGGHGGYGGGGTPCGQVPPGGGAPTSCPLGLPLLDWVVILFGLALIAFGLALLFLSLLLILAGSLALSGLILAALLGVGVVH